MSIDLNSLSTSPTIHLFGGDHDVCLPGMDGYIGPYPEIEAAMLAAERKQYDWAHIVQLSPLELKIVNVGRWVKGADRMQWQADCGPVSQREAYLKTFCAVLRGGVILIGQLPSTRLRARLVTTAGSLLEEIQTGLQTMSPASQDVAVYLIRQVITQMMTTVQRTAMTRKQESARRQWVNGASSLLKDTEALVFSSDRMTIE